VLLTQKLLPVIHSIARDMFVFQQDNAPARRALVLVTQSSFYAVRQAWQAGRPRPWPHCVRRGPSSPSPKGAHPPIVGPYLLQPNGCMDQDVTCYGGRPRPRRLCVTWKIGSPLPKKGGPKFSAHVYYGETAGWMKLVLGMEVGLSPGDFVSHGDRPIPLSPKGGTAHLPNFRPISIVAKRLHASQCHLV